MKITTFEQLANAMERIDGKYIPVGAPIEVELADYLKKSEASDTYVTKAEFAEGGGGELDSSTFLTKAEASDTYVAKSDTPISDSVIRTLPTQKGTLTYNGNEQSPEWQDFDPLKLIIDTDVSTLAATNAGNYPVGFIPLEPNTWENGGTDTVMTTWSIGKAAGFAILSATAGTFNYIPYTRTFSLYSATGTVSATSDDTDVAIVSMVNATTVSVTSSNKGGTANINVDVAEDDNHLAANVGIYKATVVNLKKLTLFANPVTCTYLEEATIYLKGNLGGGEISATSTYPDYVAITGITSDTITVRCLQYRSGNNQIKLNIQPSGDYTSATYTCSVYLQKEPSIVKKPNQLALSAESGTVVYGESLTFYVTENLSGGELSYSTQKNAVTASITNDGTDCTVTITPKNCYYVQGFRAGVL